MPRDFKRSDRVADFVKRELALLIQQEMRDPRVAGANINDVAVTRDMSIAKVYVTFLGLETREESQEAVDVLENAAGFLRSKLASVSSMRSIPKLRFYFDEVARSSEHIATLLGQVSASSAPDDSASGES